MGDLGSIPGSGRSPGDGKGYPLQYSGLENSKYCIGHRLAKSQTQLSDFHFHFLAWAKQGLPLGVVHPGGQTGGERQGQWAHSGCTLDLGCSPVETMFL